MLCTCQHELSCICIYVTLTLFKNLIGEGQTSLFPATDSFIFEVMGTVAFPRGSGERQIIPCTDYHWLNQTKDWEHSVSCMYLLSFPHMLQFPTVQRHAD